MIPVKVEVDRGVLRATLHGMNERRGPFPGGACLIALPKSVKDGLGKAWAKRTRDVNVVIGHLPPVVHNNGFVPHAPNKSGFFLGSFGTPGVEPIHIGVPRQDPVPLRPAKVHLLFGVAEPVPGKLSREVKKWHPMQPSVTMRIKFELIDGAVKEESGKFLRALAYLSNADLLHDAPDFVIVVDVKKNSCRFM